MAGPGSFVRQKWYLPVLYVTVGDVVWLADQNALRGRFRLGQVVEMCSDKKGIIRDVKVRTCHSLPVSVGHSKRDQQNKSCPSTILCFGLRIMWSNIHKTPHYHPLWRVLVFRLETGELQY